jgi:hypothetical protein
LAAQEELEVAQEANQADTGSIVGVENPLDRIKNGLTGTANPPSISGDESEGRQRKLAAPICPRNPLELGCGPLVGC